MKGIKKLLTGILAGALAFTMALSAGNATQVKAAAGQIEVKDAEVGTTYDFYRIFDLSGTDTNDPADGSYDLVSYTVNSNWVNFFTGNGAGAGYLVDTNTGSLNEINVNGAKKYINIYDSNTDSNVVAFTNAATKYAIENASTIKVASVTATAKDFTVDVDVLGYYLMIPVGASIENGNSSGSIASLNSTAPNAVIKVKAVKPSIGKKDDVISADIGKVVNYTIDGKVPNTAGYDTYTYQITDTMTAGLTYQNDAKIYVGGSEYKENDATITFDSTKNKITVDIPVTNAYFKANIGKKIEIIYTAKVNENAVELPQQKNKIQLKYGHEPYETTEYFEEELYSSKITINKTGDQGKKLANAKFVLLDATGKVFHYNATKKEVEWVTVTGVTPVTGATPITETTAISDAFVKAIADAADTSITKVVTDANGAAEFVGLKDGAYYIVEFEAPVGYNRLANPTKVVIAGKDADEKNKANENIAQAGQNEFDTQDNKVADIENKTGQLLPSTGGMGTTIFYIVGSILIIAGVAYFILRRKVNAQ